MAPPQTEQHHHGPRRWRAGHRAPDSTLSVTRDPRHVDHVILPTDVARGRRTWVRLFDTGHHRNTDALDAHSIAVVGVRTSG